MTDFPFGFGTPWPWWLIVAFGGGVSWLTLRGYFRRAAEVKPDRLLILKGLRIAGWVLLIVCLLQPMSRETTRENKSSRLTMLVDDSESMSFTDKRDGPSRMQRVKQALIGKAADDPAAESPESSALIPALSRSFQIQLEGLSTGAHSVARGSSSELLKGLRDLKGQGEATDIARGLTESFSRLKGPDAGGLVLITDGADTARGDIERAANAFKRAGTPVYVLGVGEPDMQDLSISQIRCRRTVSKDTLVRVEVDVRRTSLPEGKYNVSLSRAGKQVGSTIPLELKSETGTAVFEFLPDAQGFLEYEAKVEPFPGELVTANNTMSFGLVAYSRKLRVLYMEGSMYVHRIYNSQSSGMYYSHPMQSWWEHQFLERALTEDLDVEVDVLAKDEFSTPRNIPASDVHIKTVKEGYPKTKKDLYQYDVIINSDIPYSRFTPEQVQWTVDFVGKHGGGFVMIGGFDAFGEGGYAKTPFDRMLPVEMSAGDSHMDKDVEFNWVVTEKGWQHPIMQLEKDPEKNREAWEKLPTFHGFSRTTRHKPAAEVLAEISNEEDYGTFYGPSIVLAVQQYGNGRSMAFTTDSTGGWGTEWEDTWGPQGETDLNNRNKYFKQFWKNAVRWLAHYRMQAPNQLVQIESDRLVYGRGEQPVLRVKVMNEDYEFTHDASVLVTVAAPDGSTQQVTVFPKYDEPGIYERKLELNAVGKYELFASAKLKKEEIGTDRTILQVRPSSAEMRSLSQNVDLLTKLAAQTGGVYLPLEKASELPQHLREATHVIEKHRENDLWDRPYIFLLIIALLCGEWFLRKRSGLP